MRIIEWQPRYARLLAELWNASDAGWPTGLVRLRPKTAAEALEWERRMDSIARFLAMDGRRPIGYARLFEWWGSSDGTYVQWLNVDPAYHGKGVGKALILKTIERTIAEGYPREDLHTWPGNEKAMPLYKRTGFMWVPGSHAYLQNYVPLLLTYEPANAFFARHDWYATLRRDLKKDHDEESLHGIDVFVYRFRAGRDRLEAAIDRNARGVMAFEDRDVRVEAWIPKATLVRGSPGTIRWFVRNKGRVPLDVRLEARGPRGATVKTPPPFTLKPRGHKEVRGSVLIPDSFKDAPSGWASPAVETRVVVGNRVVPLRSGFRPKSAVDFAWEADVPRVPSPGSKSLTVVVRNQSGRALRGTLAMAAANVRLRPSRIPLRLGKQGVRRLSVRVDNPSGETRVATVRFRFSAKTIRVKKEMPLPCFAPGGIVAFRQEDDWVLESPSLQFVSASVAAKGSLRLVDGTDVIRGFWSVAGPPYEPMDALNSRWKGRLGDPGTPEIVRTFVSRRRPGLALEQRWRMVGERTLELRTAVENHGPKSWSIGLEGACERGEEASAVTIPTKHGPTTEAVMESEWPDMRRDVPLQRLMNEGWIHIGGARGGFGLVWEPINGIAPKVELSSWDLPNWFTPIVRLRSGKRHEFGRAWFLATNEWREARDLWSEIAGRERKAEAAKVGSVRLDFEPAVVLASPAAQVTATIRNLRMRPTRARVFLEAGPHLRTSAGPRPVKDLRLGKEWTKSLRISGKGPHVSSARLRFEDPRSPYRWDVPVVASDGGGTIRLRGPKEQRALANGLLTIVASATHAAALTSIRAGRHEYLVTSYPKPGSFAWFRPFYGGIYPTAYTEGWPGSLYKERFRVGAARRGTWTGLALSARAKESDLPKGTNVRIEYLTRPGSPLVALALRVRNETQERQEITAGFWAFLGLDRAPTCDVEFERLRERQWRRAEWTRWSLADGGFAVFRAPKAPRVIAMVAAEPADLEVFDLRDQGRHGLVEQELDLAPREEATVLATLAFVPPDEARGYRVLRGLTQTSFEATRSR